MSRIGVKPIEVPSGVTVSVEPGRLTVKGPLGELSHEWPQVLEVEYEKGQQRIHVRRTGNEKRARALHGLHRSLIANKIEGVSRGVEKKMEIHGTGYGVNLKGDHLALQVGYCHEVAFELPEGVSVEIERKTAQPDQAATFTVKGIDKQQVGQFAAKLRACRPPEPYKGKGVRYVGEYVRRKEGKAFASVQG